jgi:hypothetical protein
MDDIMVCHKVVYHSVGEILDHAQAVRARIYQRVENLTATQAGFKKAAGAWSVSQILEHLGLTEQYVVNKFSGVLAQAEAAGKGNASVPFAPFSMESYAEGVRDRKLESPQALLPAGNLAVHVVVEKLQASRAELMALQPRFEAHDLTQIIGPHPAYGLINPYQALAGIGLHESRHLRQIQAIMGSPGFPTG